MVATKEQIKSLQKKVDGSVLHYNNMHRAACDWRAKERDALIQMKNAQACYKLAVASTT